MKLMSTLDDYKQLRGGIHFLDKFPLSAHFKVSKSQLKKMAENMSKD